MLRKYPFYLKATVILFGLILLVYALFNLKDVLVPLAFSLLLAILLNPIANRLHRWKIPRVWAIVIAVLVAIIIIAAIGYFLSSQIAGFTDQLPLLKKKLASLILQLQREASHRFGLNMQRQQEMLSEAETSIKPLVGQTLGTLAGSVFMMVLLPVYTFLFLYYKMLILNF
ncbi:MAG TPA: AI-2E family transporter, partial [Chitinophagaceae bacterium]